MAESDDAGGMVVGMSNKLSQEKADESEPIDPTDLSGHITCFVCKGTKLSAKGKTCKTCKGIGKLPMTKFQGLFGIIKRELSTFMEKSMREVFEKYA